METLTRKVWTDAALMAVPKDKGKCELIDGKLKRMSPASRSHSFIAGRIYVAIFQFIAPERLGEVYESSAGFRLDPDNVLSPDVSYVSREWMLRSGTAQEEFFRGTPELAVEVISPSERKGSIRLKSRKYFDCGTRLIWLVYPRRKTVEVYTAADAVTTITVGELDGGDVLPGFKMPLDDIFVDWFASK